MLLLARIHDPTNSITMPIKSILTSALIGLIASAHFASAHTWIEQLMVIAPNGTLVGSPGFARGNVLRSTPGFGDPTMVNLIPPNGRTINQILPSDLMCKSSQTSKTQTNGSPRLQAAAGDAVALRFQENGHVTLPDNQPGKPKNRGTVYVYGTNQASADDTFLAIHRVWTPDGKGGDGRGRLLSTRNFDDGQCYQTNGGQISQQRQQQFKHPFDMVMGNDLWCQQDIQLPEDAQAGQPYTLYWVWDWPTLPGTAGFPNGKQEIYTTCMDVDIVGDTGTVPVSKAQVNFAQGQPYDFAAVPDQMSDLANPTAVTGQTIPFANVPTTSSTQPSSWSPTTSLLTSSLPTGSTIAFSASATGPAAGVGASKASVSTATTSNTGLPDFLSVHTGSIGGPGLETQTFTVIPISVTATDSSQPTGDANGNGRGGPGGNSNGTSSLLSQTIENVSADSNSTAGPQVTAAPNNVGNAQAVATFTEYESITQTLMQTVYVTQYTKRDAGESNFATATSAPSSSHFPHSRPWPHNNSIHPDGPPSATNDTGYSGFNGAGHPHFNGTGHSGFNGTGTRPEVDLGPRSVSTGTGQRPEFNGTDHPHDFKANGYPQGFNVTGHPHESNGSGSRPESNHLGPRSEFNRTGGRPEFSGTDHPHGFNSSDHPHELNGTDHPHDFNGTGARPEFNSKDHPHGPNDTGSGSGHNNIGPRSRFNHTGPPPWATNTAASRFWNCTWPSSTGFPHPGPTGWPRHHNNCTGDGGRHHGPGNFSITSTVQSTVTVSGTLTITTYLPSASSPSAAASASDSGSYSSTSTFTSTVTISPSAPIPLTTQSSSPSSSVLIISPIPAPSPVPTSTDQPAFRLRARNPFVMLGWMDGASEAKTTQS